jgi:hypothetical protein
VVGCVGVISWVCHCCCRYGRWECLLGRWQVVCETHVEPVALLGAKVVEYGLDLA